MLITRVSTMSSELKDLSSRAWRTLQCGGNSSGGGLAGGGDDPKSRFGYTPGGLSRGSIDSNWLESPTTSAHP